jgi:hypothetical protein
MFTGVRHLPISSAKPYFCKSLSIQWTPPIVITDNAIIILRLTLYKASLGRRPIHMENGVYCNEYFGFCCLAEALTHAQ